MTLAGPIRWHWVLAMGFGLSLAAAIAIGWTARPNPSTEPANLPTQEGPRTLQDVVQRGEFGLMNEVSPELVQSLLPFDSISLERTPCLGSCPIYRVTFHKDGHATLSEEYWSEERRRDYTSSISTLEYARLTQLVDLAKRSARESRYAGTWTDDSGAIIHARSGKQTWQVSDYGRVAPVEVWALETLLHSFKENREWTLTSSSHLLDGSQDATANPGDAAHAR